MWKYKGNGFVVGIPARDITDKEYAAMSEMDKLIVRSCGLYELEKPVKESKK